MALFAFVDLREGIAAPSAELVEVLDVKPGERLIGRRLRGVGMWDLGRELFEIVVPSRLPADLDYTADADLGGVLDVQASWLAYGEAHVDLRWRLGASETLTLHRYVEGPVAYPAVDDPPEAWEGVKDREPVGLLVFFDGGSFHHGLTWVWRRAHRLATRRPRPQKTRAVEPTILDPMSADPVVDGAGRIVADLGIMGGTPCVRGTRIPAVTVLRTLADSTDPASVLDAFPQLGIADVRAAVRYAADALESEIPDLNAYKEDSS